MDTTNMAPAISPSDQVLIDLRQQLSIQQRENADLRRSIRAAHDSLEAALNETDEAEDIASFLNDNQNLFEEFEVVSEYEVVISFSVTVKAKSEDEAREVADDEVEVRYDGDHIDFEIDEVREA
jgi:DNA-directed RNA polymerase specialized sigma subunit